MKLKYLSVGLVCVSLIFSGCASTAHFNNTPVDESEFYKDLDYLRAKYSDIDEYDRFFASPKSSPIKKELEEMWGESDTEKRWGAYVFNMALVGWIAATGMPLVLPIWFAVNPYPPERYVWDKGDYLISADGLNDSFVGYEKRIRSWEWKKNDNSIKYTEDLKISSEIASHN